MPDHGSHWQAVCGLDRYTREVVAQDLRDSALIGSAACRDVFNKTRRRERVVCLGRGGAGISHHLLLVSDSVRDEWTPYTAFPVLHGGRVHSMYIESKKPWPHGIEAWVSGRLTSDGRPLTWFHTRHWCAGRRLRPGQAAEVELAGLAYSLQPAELQPEPWPRQDSPLLPCGGTDNPDDWIFQSVIEDVTRFDHDRAQFCRLEMRFRHPGDADFALPVYVAQRLLAGYRPRPGDRVSGALWLQGRLADSRQDGS